MFKCSVLRQTFFVPDFKLKFKGFKTVNSKTVIYIFDC